MSRFRLWVVLRRSASGRDAPKSDILFKAGSGRKGNGSFPAIGSESSRSKARVKRQCSTQLRRSGAYQLVPKPVVAGAYVSTVLDDFSRCVSALVAILLNKGSF